jgi:hypothetical protein
MAEGIEGRRQLGAWCMVFEVFHIMAIAVGFEFFILGYAG